MTSEDNRPASFHEPRYENCRQVLRRLDRWFSQFDGFLNRVRNVQLLLAEVLGQSCELPDTPIGAQEGFRLDVRRLREFIDCLYVGKETLAVESKTLQSILN